MNLMKQSLIILLAAAALALTEAPDVQAGQTPSKTKQTRSTARTNSAAEVEILGLTLEKALESQQPGPTMRFGQFVTEGTSVTLLVTHPGKTIIGLDVKKSHLTNFTDDKKAELLKAKPRPRNQGMEFDFGPDDGSPLKAESRPDGHSCLVKVVGPALPASGASKITLKATLVFSCAASEKTVQQKNVALRDGTKINAGPILMTVRTGQGQSFSVNIPGQPAAQPGTVIALEMEQPPAAIKSVAFFDADGKEIKCQRNGASTFSFGNTTRTSSSYTLAKKVDKATVQVTYFDTESLSVPIDVTVDIGF